MRITDGSAYKTLLSDIERISERMRTAQNQISSGKKLSRPSDNPAAASDVIRISAEKAETAQYLTNIATGKSRLEFADSTLDGVEQATERIRALGLLALGGSSNPATFVAEITGLRDQLVASGNTQFEGQFIFGGSKTQSPPFVTAPDGTVSYAGGTDPVRFQVGRSSTLQTAVPGNEVFTASTDIFAAVNNLITALNTGDKAGINAGVGQLEQFSTSLGVSRGRLGGLMNVAQQVSNDLTQSDLAHTAKLSSLEDADLAAAITAFTQSQTALQAATTAGAKISNITILDYLR